MCQMTTGTFNTNINGSHQHYYNCNHNITYCNQCDVCYCTICGKEWKNNTWSTYPQVVWTYFHEHKNPPYEITCECNT